MTLPLASRNTEPSQRGRRVPTKSQNPMSRLDALNYKIEEMLQDNSVRQMEMKQRVYRQPEEKDHFAGEGFLPSVRQMRVTEQLERDKLCLFQMDHTEQQARSDPRWRKKGRFLARWRCRLGKAWTVAAGKKHGDLTRTEVPAGTCRTKAGFPSVSFVPVNVNSDRIWTGAQRNALEQLT